MKPGYNSVGKFTIHLFELSPSLYEVFVYETKTMYYRNITDPPFNWFSKLITYKQEITQSDVITFNTHVGRQTLCMPTFRMVEADVKVLFKLAASIK